MKRFSLLILCWILSLSSFAGTGPTQTINGNQLSYYGADFSPNMSGDLKTILYQILASKHGSREGKPDVIGSCSNATCYQHTPVGYSNARTILFGELYIEKDTRGNFVTEVYCDEKVYFKHVSDISRMDRIVNIEHTWPQSKFSSAYNKDLQKSDLHHLYPSNSKANSVRGNYEFGDPKQGIDQDVPGCPISQITNTSVGRVFTPPIEHRGNVARALFYFSIRYKLPISKSQEQVIRKWHKADPVDQEEETRHELIAERQLNRNPFIDFPELVDKISDF